MKLRKLNEICQEWSHFSDAYLVGDDGFLYAAHNGHLKRLKSGYYRSGKKYGYQQVRGHFGVSKKQTTVKVHRAVAMAFIPQPFGANDVDHINNDKSDNRVENLQWLTHRENIIKRYRQKVVI